MADSQIDMNLLCEVQLAKMISHSVCFFFTLLIVSFAIEKFLASYNPICQFLVPISFLSSRLLGFLFQICFHAGFENTTEYNLTFVFQNVCQTLWCSVRGFCRSKLDAAADGTRCGEKKVICRWPEEERWEGSWPGVLGKRWEKDLGGQEEHPRSLSQSAQIQERIPLLLLFPPFAEAKWSERTG